MTSQTDTEKHLENILNYVAQTEDIKNYDIHFNTKPAQGDGFLSEFFNGHVLNKDNGKILQVAIKKLPVGGFSHNFGNEILFRNEMNFYSEVFPELDNFQRTKDVKDPFNNIPRYFAGSVDSENIFIAMENLKTADYVLFDKRKHLDSTHLKYIFKTYGKFHALSFTFKKENPQNFENLMKKITNCYDKFIESDDMMNFIEKAYHSALETFDPISEGGVLIRLKRIEDVRETMKDVQFYKGSYNCLTHGDCWSNNMLFKYKESGDIEDIKLIDFQLMCSSTPIHDLSYFFYSGASKEDMDKLDYYLDLYYESFSEFAKNLGGNAEELFPIEVLKSEWKKYAVQGIFNGCQLLLAKLLDKNEITEVLNQRGLSQDKYFELFNEKFDEIRKGSIFKETARNICLHAIEYGIL